MARSTDPVRRGLLATVALVVLSGLAVAEARVPVAVEVWKDPSCGCCKYWIRHLEGNGFQVTVHDTGNNGVRAQLRIDRKFGSCHTAVVGGYAIEGHVPAADIQRLLRERPQAIGLAVAGMPVGTPGMDSPVYKGRHDAFDVILLARNGGGAVYRRYEASEGK